MAVLLISNIASTKIVLLGPFTFDGGTILFPLSYIFGDVLTEVYGYARSRRVIRAGFAAELLMALVLAVVGALPAAAGWTHQEAYRAILGQTPRIVAASLVAYFAGEFQQLLGAGPAEGAHPRPLAVDCAPSARRWWARGWTRCCSC